MDSVELREKRKSLGLTQKEFASLIGVSGNTIINWEGGKKIPASKYTILRSVFDKHTKNTTKSEKSDTEKLTGYYYPDVAVKSGLEKSLKEDKLKRLPVSLPEWDEEIEFINVYGDSMYPEFCAGQIIGIKEVESEFMHYGYAYVVVLRDDQVFLNYIKKGKNDEYWLLSSENPKYESREFHKSLIKKIFIIKGVISKTTM